MDWQRLVFVTVLEVLQELTSRLGHHDLSGQCSDCLKEVPDARVEPGKEG